MQHLGKWAAGIIGGVLAIAVLFYAANATSAGTYNSALFVFVVLLVFVFAQIKRGFDQAYKARHDGDDSGADEAGGSGAEAGRASAGTAQASGASAKQAGGQSTAKSGATKSGAAKASGGRSASGTAKSAAAGGAAKHGLSESAPSGPTNGTGAKH
ncbi:MAG: hypothetical protein U5L06_07820 [Rhodovibrio sp.]|nr:hypothetical protein [Rhodovibrio sp.]